MWSFRKSQYERLAIDFFAESFFKTCHINSIFHYRYQFSAVTLRPRDRFHSFIFSTINFLLLVVWSNTQTAPTVWLLRNWPGTLLVIEYRQYFISCIWIWVHQIDWPNFMAAAEKMKNRIFSTLNCLTDAAFYRKRRGRGWGGCCFDRSRLR